MRGALGGLTMLVEVRAVGVDGGGGSGEGGVEGTETEMGRGGNGVLSWSGFSRWGVLSIWSIE